MEKMQSSSRRDFLRRIALATPALAIPGMVLRCASKPPPGSTIETTPIDAIGPVAAEGSGATLLELPEGFDYVVLGEEGSPLLDGRPTPGLHGGIGVFAFKDRIRIIRSHGSVNPVSTAPGDPLHIYDPVGGGSTTTIDLAVETGEVMLQRTSLGGTANNAGGGPTPWMSWIFCEATTRGVGSGYTQPHGYCFEARVDLDGGIIPVPLKGMGRFVHVSVCMDPVTQFVYLTEHALDGSGFYRFIPRRQRSLAAGGTLQILSIANQPGFDPRQWSQIGEPMAVEWRNTPEADPQAAEEDPHAVFKMGLAVGGIPFGRGGGVVYDDGAIFFTTLDGTGRLSRRLWEYRVRASRDREKLPTELVSTLQLRNERPESSSARIGGELCIAPDGTLLIAERNAEVAALRAFTRTGRVYDFALIVDESSQARFGGAAFTPDGTTLFINQQSPGKTFAVRGPWARLGL